MMNLRTLHKWSTPDIDALTISVMSEKVCKILLVLALMLGVPQAWGKFVMLIYLCHFT